jgi:phage terminase Nu1 subunit (DNA packaging protein)
MGLSWPRRGTPSSTARGDAAELAVHRAFVRQLTAACNAAAAGDLEARA